ncbi:hypothetical protein DAERI_090158 [Deinococcus aerius]|uniref:Uncharacterized protein n=2 Tax=Deinococcus aerius TaxID=200253 RepID=A0A2I9CX18_9DEIO|nr:hypothetical protein DAERI_090158 [Deinococcus aerius]
MMLGAVGLSAVLASCGGVAIDDSQGPRSQYQLATDARDTNTGKVIPKGTYVICDNKSTDVELDVNWLVGTSKINLLAFGEYYGEGRYLDTYQVDPSTGGSGTLVFTIEKGVAPQNLNVVKPQAIIVTPITNVNVKGYTRLGAQAVNAQGVAGTIQQSDYVFPVVDCL